MTRWGVIVASIVAAAGCDKLIGVNHYDEPRDAPGILVDATPIRCTDLKPAPAVCADFDEAQPLVYTDSVPSQWQLSGIGVTPSVIHPGRDSEGALQISTTGTGTFFKTFNPSASATVVTASFDLQVEQESMVQSDTGLMRIAFEGSGHSSCYANLMIAEDVHMLRVNGACGSCNAHGELAVPFGWVHVDFTFDLTGDVVATMQINGAAMAKATFFVSTPPDLSYSVNIGTDSAVGLTGLIVDYDSIVVTSHN